MASNHLTAETRSNAEKEEDHEASHTLAKKRLQILLTMTFIGLLCLTLIFILAIMAESPDINFEDEPAYADVVVPPHITELLDKTGLTQTPFPSVVGIKMHQDGFCTGVLVAEDLVLTAGHCLYEEKLEYIELFIGGHTTFKASFFFSFLAYL